MERQEVAGRKATGCELPIGEGVAPTIHETLTRQGVSQRGIVPFSIVSMGSLFLAVLLFFVAHSWAACTTISFSNWRFDCNGSARSITCKNSFSFSTGCSNGCSTIGYWSDGGSMYCSGGVVTSRNCDYFGDGTNPPRSGMFSGTYQACDTKCEADSVANYASCIAQGNRWENCECVSPPPLNPDSCRTKSCCDSANYVLPVSYDTLDLGCQQILTQETESACEEKHAYTLDGQEARSWYECNGLPILQICAVQYVMDGTNKCSPLPTNDCYEITDWKNSDRCQGVICQEMFEWEIHDLSYDDATGMWNGLARKMIWIECSNGSRTIPTYDSPVPYAVSQKNIDASGTGSIGGYLASHSPGGEGTDNQGNAVTNSPGLGIGGGAYTNNTAAVTATNPSTGAVTTVSNGAGTGDSLKTEPKQSGMRCLGVSSGVATMTDGTSTWTVYGVQSCMQAELQCRLGDCGQPGGSGLGQYDNSTQLSWGDSVRTTESGKDYSLALDNLSRTATWFYNYFAFPNQYRNFADAINTIVTSINSGTERSIYQRDSLYERAKTELWREVFGNDLSNVSVIRDSVGTLSTAIKSASSSTSEAIAAQTSAITLSNDDVATRIVNKVGSASSTLKAAIDTASSQIRTSVGNVQTALIAHSGRMGDSLHALHSTAYSINEHTRQLVENGDSMRVRMQEYQDLISEHNSMFDAFNRSMLDTVAQTNSILRDIRNAVRSSGSSEQSSSSSLNTDYPDTLDYSLDSNIALADSITSEYVGGALDSLHRTLSRLQSSMDSTFAHVDSVRAADNNNLLAMDSIYKWHKDTTRIKQKFSNLFLPSQVSNNCFVCTYKEKWGKWDVDLSFNLANIYGMDLCDLIRKLVRIGVSIFIIFGTIAAFIRAFGGGGGGSP